MVPLHIHIVIKGWWQHALWDPSLLLLTNDAQKLTPYKFEFNSDANRIQKDYQTSPVFRSQLYLHFSCVSNVFVSTMKMVVVSPTFV
jgi:hypothetical protein